MLAEVAIKINRREVASRSQALCDRGFIYMYLYYTPMFESHDVACIKHRHYDFLIASIYFGRSDSGGKGQPILHLPCFTLQESQHCLDLAWVSDSLLAFICFEPLDSTLAISFSLTLFVSPYMQNNCRTFVKITNRTSSRPKRTRVLWDKRVHPYVDQLLALWMPSTRSLRLSSLRFRHRFIRCTPGIGPRADSVFNLHK